MKFDSIYEQVINEGLFDRAKAKFSGAVAGAKQLGTAAKQVGSAISSTVSGGGKGFKKDIKQAVSGIKQAAGNTKFKTRIQSFIDASKKQLEQFRNETAEEVKANPSIMDTVNPISQQLDELFASLQQILDNPEAAKSTDVSGSSGVKSFLDKAKEMTPKKAAPKKTTLPPPKAASAAAPATSPSRQRDARGRFIKKA